MTTQDFILTLFCHVDQQMLAIPKHPEAKLSPSAVGTLALLFAIQREGMRAFYRWRLRDYQGLFPQVPERTRLARLFKTHTAWTAAFVAAPTVLGVADRYDIELLHPMREGRSPAQMGKKGKSHHRWIVGGKLGFVVNPWGVVCAWDCATANVADQQFHPLMAQFDDCMMVRTETGFHAKTGDPANYENLSARDVEWTDGGGNRLFAADHRFPEQEGRTSPVGLFSGPRGVDHGCV